MPTAAGRGSIKSSEVDIKIDADDKNTSYDVMTDEAVNRVIVSNL